MANQNTLHTIAYEMLTTTNVFKKKVEDIYYGSEENKISLLKLINERLAKQRGGYRNNSMDNLRIVFNAISDMMIKYLESFPAPFSFKQKTKDNFKQWLERIINKYEIVNADIPKELVVNIKQLDTGIKMLKALHTRNGANLEELKKVTAMESRTIQKSLRKISPKLYEGDPEEMSEVYCPFRIGDQPIKADIHVRIDTERKRYYNTPNTVHPIVLQENLMQVGTLIKALSCNYWENESNISSVIAIDIWSQLTKYAKERIKDIFAFGDVDLLEFIQIIDDECPDDHVCAYQTEREMQQLIDMSTDEIIKFLEKAPSRSCIITFKDGTEMRGRAIQRFFENDKMLCSILTPEDERISFDINLIKRIKVV